MAEQRAGCVGVQLRVLCQRDARETAQQSHGAALVRLASQCEAAVRQGCLAVRLPEACVAAARLVKDEPPAPPAPPTPPRRRLRSRPRTATAAWTHPFRSGVTRARRRVHTPQLKGEWRLFLVDSIKTLLDLEDNPEPGDSRRRPHGGNAARRRRCVADQNGQIQRA